jgi:hypothetical protein
MPDNIYPPPDIDLGGKLEPRQLNRWLDVNPQGGELKRTEGYFGIPAFSVAYTWQGMSDIVLAFNYSGPNNFVLKQVQSQLPASPNYVMCISWQKAGIVYRYKLTGSGGVFYFDLVPYTGQSIGKNFRIEIWSTETSPVVQSTPINLYSGVRGYFDYRFASDYAMVANDTPVTLFTSNLQQHAPSDVSYAKLMNNFMYDYGLNATTGNWSDVMTADLAPWSKFTQTVNVVAGPAGSVPGAALSFTGVLKNIFKSYTNNNSVAVEYLVIYLTDGYDGQVFLFNGATFSINVHGDIVSYTDSGAANAKSDTLTNDLKIKLVLITIFNGTAAASNIKKYRIQDLGKAISDPSGTGSMTFIPAFAFNPVDVNKITGVQSSPFTVFLEYAFYNNVTDPNQDVAIQNYFFNKYNNVPVVNSSLFVFPANSIVPINQ